MAVVARLWVAGELVNAAKMNTISTDLTELSGRVGTEIAAVSQTVTNAIAALGTASTHDVGTGSGQVPELDSGGHIDNARLANIPRTSLRFGEGEAMHSGSSSTFFYMHDYALPPAVKYFKDSGGSIGDGFLFSSEKTTASTVSSFTSYQPRGRIQTHGNSDGTGRAIWRYLSASDMPSVWVLLGDDNAILAMFEAEDPVRDGDATSPISKHVLDDDGQPTGVMLGRAVNVGLPSHAVIAALYDALDATQKPQYVMRLSDYVVAERGWLDSLTVMADLQQIEARYEPSGRQWAMRVFASVLGLSVTGLYQTHLSVSALDAWEHAG